jgi:hypothetical protein
LASSLEPPESTRPSFLQPPSLFAIRQRGTSRASDEASDLVNLKDDLDVFDTDEYQLTDAYPTPTSDSNIETDLGLTSTHLLGQALPGRSSGLDSRDFAISGLDSESQSPNNESEPDGYLEVEHNNAPDADKK